MLTEQGDQSYLALCAILKGSGQIFWPLHRMPVSPGAFLTPKVLPLFLSEWKRVMDSAEEFQQERGLAKSG
jgi:hypothetical protein